MNFLKLFLRAIALIPGVVQGTEALFGAKTGDQACDTCLQNSCCGEFVACIKDDECVKLNNCIADCQNGTSPDGGSFDAGDTSDGGAEDQCINACLAAHPSQTAQNELLAKDTCEIDKCVKAGNPDGGLGPCGIP